MAKLFDNIHLPDKSMVNKKKKKKESRQAPLSVTNIVIGMPMRESFEKVMKQKSVGGTNTGIDKTRYYEFDERSSATGSPNPPTVGSVPTTSQEKTLASLASQQPSTAGASSTQMTEEQPSVSYNSIVSRVYEPPVPSSLKSINISDPFLRDGRGNPIGSRADYVPPTSIDPYIRTGRGVPVAERADFNPNQMNISSPVLRDARGRAIASNASYNPSKDPYSRNTRGDVTGLKSDVEKYFQSYYQQNQPTSATILASKGRITSSAGQKYSPYGKTSVNRGTDIAVPIGTNVAVPDGKWEVLSVYDGARRGIDEKRSDFGVNGGWGNSVLVRNQQTGETLRFSHLDVNGVSLKPQSVGTVLDGGTVVGRVGVTGHTTGPHLDVEYKDESGQLRAVEKSKYGTGLFPSGGANWYKGVGGKEDIKYGLDENKEEDGLLKKWWKTMKQPIPSSIKGGDYPGLLTQALYGLNPELAPGTAEDKQLIDKLAAEDPYKIGLLTKEDKLMKPITTRVGDVGMGQSEVMGLGNRLTDQSSYEQNIQPIYSGAIRSAMTPMANDYNPNMNQADMLIANRGVNTKGLSQAELESLRANALALDAATRNNLLASAAAARGEQTASQGRLREYFGRARRDLSGTTAGQSLANAFSEKSAEELGKQAIDLGTKQAALETGFGQQVTSARQAQEARDLADRNLLIQAAIKDAERKQEAGTFEDYLTKQEDTRRTKELSTYDLYKDTSDKIQSLLTERKAKGKTVEEKAEIDKIVTFLRARRDRLQKELGF